MGVSGDEVSLPKLRHVADVYVNGQSAGRHENGVMAFGVDVTPLLKAGENEIQLTVPAGDLTTGVVYDYLRLELDPKVRLDGSPLAAR